VAFNPNSGRSLDKSPTDPRLYIGKMKSPCVSHKTNLFRPLFTVHHLPAECIPSSRWHLYASNMQHINHNSTISLRNKIDIDVKFTHARATPIYVYI